MFLLNAYRVKITKSTSSTDITTEWNLFIFESLFKINDKINSSTTQDTFALLLMLPWKKAFH